MSLDIWKRLHPVTLIMTACAIVGFVTAGWTLVGTLHPILQYRDSLGPALQQALPTFAYDSIWALGFLGTGATVEFMFRIWTELRKARLEDEA